MKTYIANENIISENVGIKETDDVMLFNQETEDVHVVNSVAYEIFSALKQPRSDSELVKIFSSLYSIEGDSIRDDIKELLADFLHKDIIKEI